MVKRNGSRRSRRPIPRRVNRAFLTQGRVHLFLTIPTFGEGNKKGSCGRRGWP
jgi:hypothetical protein